MSKEPFKSALEEKLPEYIRNTPHLKNLSTICNLIVQRLHREKYQPLLDLNEPYEYPSIDFIKTEVL